MRPATHEAVAGAQGGSTVGVAGSLVIEQPQPSETTQSYFPASSKEGKGKGKGTLPFDLAAGWPGQRNGDMDPNVLEICLCSWAEAMWTGKLSLTQATRSQAC